MAEKSVFGNKNFDLNIECRISEVFEKFNISPTEALKHFPVFSRRVDLRRFLAHYELFKLSADLPGDIVELGVFRGLSLMSFANFLEIFNCTNRRKRVIGFDTFKGFVNINNKDLSKKNDSDKQAGDFDASNYYECLKEAITIFDEDRFIPWKKRIELFKGDICKTIPAYIEKNPGLRISLLHFDCDLYDPTKIGLKELFPLVVKGGVVIFDEYGDVNWPGESEAVDEYLKDKSYVVKQFKWSPIPGGYLIK
ncbi:dTDP-6-deoxy-L-hexose 3-O-methyltransferase [Desulfamplus magnetovallimortis]|uniref:dTDP-6-deoxy-L-hexose 3-O-methyltransferase n=1 Tax=Desulfamplus magnetovallimortis TaxID=1246637 RepID=A0A1W1HEP0_9BACT|nr:TylF/MycF/NovP-related O-methyltransferase [Desulfamplus magnetovallimortis]SLM30896.1 dTDP-6-deoxy-L-hexose 3-O-methyltransferase [Desulfamplus magnetovallimortis]